MTVLNISGNPVRAANRVREAGDGFNDLFALMADIASKIQLQPEMKAGNEMTSPPQIGGAQPQAGGSVVPAGGGGPVIPSGALPVPVVPVTRI